MVTLNETSVGLLNLSRDSVFTYATATSVISHENYTVYNL
jgi:hypothetical protein